MNGRNLVLMGLMVLIGLALAFAVIFVTDGNFGRTEDVWLIHNPMATNLSGLPHETGLGSNLKTESVDSTSHLSETTDSSTTNKTTGEVLAQNQSALLLSFGETSGTAIVELENSQTEQLSAEQIKLAEIIALSDTRVQNILGAGMYSADVHVLDNIHVENFEELPRNGTDVSVIFTIINTTTAENESAFFVHVDLDNGRVIRISPLFPQN